MKVKSTSTKSKLRDVKLCIADLDELRLLLRASRHSLQQGYPIDEFSPALYMEKSVTLVIEMADRLEQHYKGSPHERYTAYKAGDSKVGAWS